MFKSFVVVQCDSAVLKESWDVLAYFIAVINVQLWRASELRSAWKLRGATLLLTSMASRLKCSGLFCNCEKSSPGGLQCWDTFVRFVIYNDWAALRLCSSATVQPCDCAAVWLCSLSTVQPFDCAALQLCSSATVQQWNWAALPLWQCSIALRELHSRDVLVNLIEVRQLADKKGLRVESRFGLESAFDPR